MNKLPKRLVLNHSNWRCGVEGDEAVKLGIGPTQLLNSYGYMCCVGQFCKQAGLHDYEILGLNIRPHTHVEGLTIENCIMQDNTLSLHGWVHSCATINDSEARTIARKVVELARILRNQERRLAIKNFPEHVISNEEVRDAIRDGILEIETNE